MHITAADLAAFGRSRDLDICLGQLGDLKSLNFPAPRIGAEIFDFYRI